MDSSNSPFINPDDPDHPLVHISKRNEDESLFLKRLALEVRLMIYEFAVAMDDAVEPVQQAERSNKFFSDRFSGTPSTVVCLGRICRKIYQELENYPVFYRVNKFQFFTSYDMHKFFAAIHPKRLVMIRTIRLTYGNAPTTTGVWGKGDHFLKHVLALLSQCTNLEDLSLILQQNGGNDLSYFLVGWEGLVKDSLSQPALINLPVFKVFLRYSPGGPEYPLEEALGHSQFIQTKQTKEIFTAIVHGMKARKIVFDGLPEVRINDKKDYRPEWLRNMADGTAINEAIKAAAIDFPGHKRIAQDVRAMSDNVSCRTRRKFQAVNEIGVVYRKVPQFDGGGLLTWAFNEIKEVRWTDSEDIELEVRWCQPARVPETSWVPFSSLEMNGAQEETMLAFYRKVMQVLPDPSRLESYYQKIKYMPSLSVIAEYAGGVDDFLNKNAPTSRVRTGEVTKKRFRAWAYWTKAWENNTARLERELRKQKKEAAEAEAEAAKAREAREAEEAAKAKKAANKDSTKKKGNLQPTKKASKVTKAKSVKAKKAAK
ncbi:uncharacterized protein F4812DRAFT_467416 [Daldinia caldariorum]|uniref:uncharacterized protein n=1 Tax=Daldinia caldariorum TaxID=326644 RepID=UPI00200883AB|nr:uncharacterized protein F4812DRAFT_467416 [Daldinia caldariorum]KAI1471276.1 hypothetical protein F4812DRAFT_467416 [Daldinia caldariorum]